MNNLIRFYQFSEKLKPIKEDWGEPDYDDDPEPESPKIDYPEKDRLFELVADVPYLCLTLLKGKPAVGGGVWVISHDCGIPEEYLYSYPYEKDISYDERLTPDSSGNWATDIWKKQKDRIGEGVEDFYLEGVDTSGWKVSDYKLLIKVDSELRERLIEDLDESLSLRYERGSEEPYRAPSYNSAKTRDEMRKALFFLERYSG